MSVWGIALLLVAGGWAESPRDYAARVDAILSQQLSQSDSDAHGPYWCTEIHVNSKDHPWPAVGIYRLDYQFYFDRDEGDARRDPNPYPDRLIKVVGRRHASDRWEQREVWFREGLPVYFRLSSPAGVTPQDLTGPTTPRLQQAKREAVEIHRIFRGLGSLP
ncbi:hypothetical protein IV102_25815 [bacterium]|nr:hypothetical protein [bacterium]